MRRGKAWNEEEKQLVINHYNSRGVKYIEEILPHRSTGAIMEVAYKLRNQGRMSRTMDRKVKRSGRPETEPPKEVIQKQLEKALASEEKIKDYGVGKKDLSIELKKGKSYRVKKIDIDSRLNDKERYFVGELVQKTDKHITLKNRRDLRECFLKVDALIGEIEIEEVRK